MIQIHASESWGFFLLSLLFHTHAFYPHFPFTYTLHMSQKNTSLIPRPYVFFVFFHLTFSHALLYHIHTSHVSKTRVRFPGLIFFITFLNFFIYSCLLLMHLISFYIQIIKFINHANKFRFFKH